MSKSLSDCHTHLVQSHGLVAAELDGELVMMDAEAGQYYGISGVGARAFELLKSPISLNKIIEAIALEYDVDEQTCRRDMQVFVMTLMENGLVQKANE